MEEDSRYQGKKSTYGKRVENYVRPPTAPEPPQLWIQITIVAIDDPADLPQPRCQQVDADGRPNSQGRFLLVPLPESFKGDPMLEMLDHGIEVKKLWNG